MKKPILLLRILLIYNSFFYSLPSFAQEEDISSFYLNKDMNETEKAEAAYVGIAAKEHKLWHVIVTHFVTKKTVLSAYYKDYLLTIPEGLYQTFYDDGRRKSRGYYHEGVKAAMWRNWNEAGHLTDSIFYEKDYFKYAYTWGYTIKNVLWRYSYINTDSATKHIKLYDVAGDFVSEIRSAFKPSLEKTPRADGSVFELVRYDEDGNTLSKRYFKKNGKEITEERFLNIVYNRIRTYSEDYYKPDSWLGFPEPMTNYVCARPAVISGNPNPLATNVKEMTSEEYQQKAHFGFYLGCN